MSGRNRFLPAVTQFCRSVSVVDTHTANYWSQSHENKQGSNHKKFTSSALSPSGSSHRTVHFSRAAVWELYSVVCAVLYCHRYEQNKWWRRWTLWQFLAEVSWSSVRDITNVGYQCDVCRRWPVF